jgi:hypothetical protein
MHHTTVILAIRVTLSLTEITDSFLSHYCSCSYIKPAHHYFEINVVIAAAARSYMIAFFLFTDRALCSSSLQTVRQYSLTLVIPTSRLLSSILYLQLSVDQYVEKGESFSLFVKVLQNWTVQMRILNSPFDGATLCNTDTRAQATSVDQAS